MKPINLAISLAILLLSVKDGKAQVSKKIDTNTIISLNQSAWKLRNNDLEQAKQMALQAIQQASKIDYQRGLSYSYNILGHYYKVKSQYDSAQVYYQKSLVIRQFLRDTIPIAQSYRNIMSIEKLLGNNQKAITTGLLAIQLLALKPTNIKALTEKAWVEVNIASIYTIIGDYEKAVNFAVKGKTEFKKQQDEEGFAAASMNLGIIFKEQKQYTKALNEFNFVINYFLQSNNQRELAKAYNNLGVIYYDLNKYDLALTNYKKSISIRLQNDYKDDLTSSLKNIGIIHEIKLQFDSAYKYYKQALDLSNQSGDLEGQYESNRLLGVFFTNQKKYSQALPPFLQALRLSEQAGVSPEKILLLKEISNLYQSSGNKDSALIYTNLYTNLNDSLNEILRSSIELEAKLKEKELELVISKEKNRSQLVIIYAVVGFLVLILIIFWLYSRAAKAKRREFEFKELIKEKELMLLDAKLVGEEDERKRLGTELHDTIGSILSATKYAFKAMETSIEKLVAENKNQYQKINKMLDDAMDAVRKISHNMVTGSITEKGLEGALIELCEMFEQSGNFKIELNVHGVDVPMDYKIERNIYLILQELMTNILKHSDAKKVSIQLLKNKEEVNLIIEDDGRGFNPTDPHLKKGLGLSSIDSRIKSLNANWTIDSNKGNGTTVIVDIPINEDI